LLDILNPLTDHIERKQGTPLTQLNLVARPDMLIQHPQKRLNLLENRQDKGYQMVRGKCRIEHPARLSPRLTITDQE
jgi:hypothetical protein